MFALTRIVTEFWKLFIRVEPQDDFRIPTQIHRVNGVIQHPLPRLLLGVIAGGMSGVATNLVLDNGLVATPSPGSVFAYMAVTPPGDQFKVLLAIAVSAGVSFLVCSFLLKTQKHVEDMEDLDEARARSQAMKG